MERNFYNEEFEQFLKQKSDQYKMYPSDRVWNNVHSSLHNKRRWTGLGLILLFITSSALISREIFLNNFHQLAQHVNQAFVIPAFSGYSATNHSTDQKNQIQVIVSNKKPLKVYLVHQEITAGSGSVKTPADIINLVAADNNLISSTAFIPQSESQPVVLNKGIPEIRAFGNLPSAAVIISQPEIMLKQKTDVKITNEKEENNPKLSIQNYNGYIGIVRTSKWSLQLYASPIVSYRRLSNLNNRSDKYVPVAINYAGNLDNYVHHKPAVGFELGTKVQYEISKSLHLYAGAQLNYSRYYIDAYNYHSEKASIALNNSQVADTVTNYTSIRNFDGYSPEQLQNQYFQLSVPVGAELKLLGNKRLQLSIAGAIQPTYLISSNSYLISSDYKNYIQNPDLARRFNVHTNFEAFVSYKLGGLKWQLGPQFRYQLLSSYSDKYPIREYLTEFGIKLGITKTIW
jgi:hypothetical protein